MPITYIAPAATHIFGTFYAKGATVDVSTWSDRAITEALDRGWITPSGGIATETDPVAGPAITAETSARTTADSTEAAARAAADTAETTRAQSAEARARQSVAVTSSSLVNNTSQQTSVTMAKGFRLIHLQTDKAARVRVYTNAAAQAADVARAVGVDPGAGSGVILDYVTTGAQSSDLSPMPDGHNTEATPNTTVPVTITNLSGGTATVTVTFTWQQTEG